MTVRDRRDAGLCFETTTAPLHSIGVAREACARCSADLSRGGNENPLARSAAPGLAFAVLAGF
jgi:hypothetical protein